MTESCLDKEQILETFLKQIHLFNSLLYFDTKFIHSFHSCYFDQVPLQLTCFIGLLKDVE